MDDPDNITNDENDALDSGEPDSVHVTGEPHPDGGDNEEDKVNPRIYYRGAEPNIYMLL